MPLRTVSGDIDDGAVGIFDDISSVIRLIQIRLIEKAYSIALQTSDNFVGDIRFFRRTVIVIGTAEFTESIDADAERAQYRVRTVVFIEAHTVNDTGTHIEPEVTFDTDVLNRVRVSSGYRTPKIESMLIADDELERLQL